MPARTSTNPAVWSAAHAVPRCPFATRKRINSPLNNGMRTACCGMYRSRASGSLKFPMLMLMSLFEHSPSAVPPAGEAVIYTPDNAAEALAHPPSKRRRAKRTEEERIEYLRADPYVGQFEAYRVLCASCDKWIRLRPNSTYCSIPWDAHRKSCLAKKMYVS